MKQKIVSMEEAISHIKDRINNYSSYRKRCKRFNNSS